MDFYSWFPTPELLYKQQALKRTVTLDEYYHYQIEGGRESIEILERMNGGKSSHASGTYLLSVRQQMAERNWCNAHRPYYHIYPSIVPMLLKLKLKVASRFIRLPQGAKTLNLRFPVDHKIAPLSFQWKGEDVRVKGILAMENDFTTDEGGRFRMLSIWLDIDEARIGSLDELPMKWRDSVRPRAQMQGIKIPPLLMPVYTYRSFRLEGNGTYQGLTSEYQDPDSSVEDRMKDLELHLSFEEGIVVPNEVIENCVRVVCTVCLIGDDPELIERDVLGKDRPKVHGATEEEMARIIGRADRKGKIGWILGRRYDERGPYLVPPHPQGYWVGPGRKQYTIKTRSGYITKKDKVMNVPTGYEEEPVT